MSNDYEFSTTTRNGTEYVIAQPRSQGEPVRFEAKWIESGDMGGKWEQIIKPVIKDSLMGVVDVDAADGRLARTEFVRQLASATDDEGNAIVSSERQADALVAFLASNGVLDATGGEIVFLQDPSEAEKEETSVSRKMWINWAACVDACIEQIESTIETVEKAKERLENHKQNVEESTNRGEQYLEEVAQELRALGEGPEVPDPADLDSQEEQRYHTLKKEFVFHNQMQEVKTGSVLHNLQNGEEVLSQTKRKLESAMEALDSQSGDIRQAALTKGVFPEGAMNFVNNVGDFTTQLANAQGVDEKAKQMSPEDLESDVASVIGPAKEISETTDRITEGTGERERQERTDTA